jgi:hypothetical protein
MIARATTVALAVALWGAAGQVAGDAPRRAADEVVASLARPFALPSLWRRFAAATRSGDPAEAIASGRLVARLLPAWTDGLLHVAWICALDLAREGPTAESGADHLLTALGWLEEAADRAADRPERAAEILDGAAILIEARTARDPRLGAAFRRTLGRDPASAAHDLLERARRLDPGPLRDQRRAFATLRLGVSAIRMGDLARAEAILGAAGAELAALADPHAAATAAALRALRPLSIYLTDRDARRALAADPLVGALGRALEDLADG